jgi:hypothetical protein
MPKRTKRPEKHPVLLDKASLAVHEVAVADASRYIIDHVHVDQDGTAVATNARLLLAVQPPDVDAGDLPAGLLEPADVSNDGLNLPASMCKTVMGNLKGHAFRPILECAVVTRCDGSLVEVSSTTDLKRVKREGEVPAEGAFPDWKGMVNRPIVYDETETGGDVAEQFGPVVQMGMCLDVLDQLVKALKKIISDDTGPFVRFTFNANAGMVLIDGKVEGERRFIGATGRIADKNVDTTLSDLNDWQKAILDYVSKDAVEMEEEDEDAEED